MEENRYVAVIVCGARKFSEHSAKRVAKEAYRVVIIILRLYKARHFDVKTDANLFSYGHAWRK